MFSLLERNLDTVRAEPYEWFTFLGNRFLVAGLLTALFALLLAALVWAKVVVVTHSGQMIFLAQGLLTATVTLITIVLSINQLVLSRELGTPGELHDDVQDVIAYRNHVEETTNREAVPSTPVDFLSVLLDGTRSNAQRLGGVVRGQDPDQLRDEVDGLVSTITSHVDEITEVLARSERGIFDTLAASLQMNFSRQLHEAQRLQTVYDDELSPDAHEMLDEVIDSLQQVDIARQYFKSLYIQSELAQLSRLLLYVGVPAVGGAILMYLVYVGGPRGAVPPEYLTVFILLVVVLGFSLIAILCSYVLRIATVAQRTVAITPFTTPGMEIQNGESDDDEIAP